MREVPVGYSVPDSSSCVFGSIPDFLTWDEIQEMYDTTLGPPNQDDSTNNTATDGQEQ